jgi:hypothetical protein
MERKREFLGRSPDCVFPKLVLFMVSYGTKKAIFKKPTDPLSFRA